MFNTQVIRRLSPYLLILIFFLFKLSHLNISFFWDESWVYAPAIRTMAELGPSLLPDSISLDYSRGHPLLFYFLGSSWISLFGEGFFSMHFFALMISIVFLTISVLFLNNIGKNRFSFWVVLILCVQPIFVAQSSMVLPEMLLAALSMSCIYFYSTKRIGLYLLFGILAILTKETGILIIITITIYDFIKNISEKRSVKDVFKFGILYSLPLLTLVGHMVYLKAVFGWYLYPEHTGLIQNNLIVVLTNFSSLIKDQVWGQSRLLITIPFVALYVYHLITKKSFSTIIFIILSGLISIYAYLFLGLNFSVAIIYCLFAGHFVIERFIKGTDNEKILLLLFLFIIIYGVFSAANFYTVRYLLSTFLLTLVIPLYFLLVHSSLKKYIPILLLGFTPLYIYNLTQPKSINDINLTYLNYCPLQLEVVKYFEDQGLYKERINTKFLMTVALTDPKAGYRQTSEVFEYVNKGKDDSGAYYIFYNVENEDRRNEFKGEMIKRYEKGNIWFEIWKSNE